jgi:hypothetical protein
MPWKTDNSVFVLGKQAFFFLLAAFFLAGCAGKPWTDPLGDTAVDAITQQVDALVARDARCGRTLEGDVVLFYENPLQKKALSGFLQFSMPSSYKIVMTNPLGQPVLVIAGNQESFQAINTLDKKYLAGSIRSFGLRNNIPEYFLKSDWGSLLTGRNLLPSRAITSIRNDRNNRGVWLTFQSEEQSGVSHLLLDRQNEVFLERILENGRGQTVAKISYGGWVSLGTCRQPLDISIAELDYGTDVHIKLENVDISDEKKKYRLQPPPGYSQYFMP